MGNLKKDSEKTKSWLPPGIGIYTISCSDPFDKDISWKVVGINALSGAVIASTGIVGKLGRWIQAASVYARSEEDNLNSYLKYE